MQLSEAAGVLDAALHGSDARFAGVSTDTRTLQSGALFVALRGPNFDAHDVLEQALEKGASGAVVERSISIKMPWIGVEATREALGRLAADWRRRFDIPVIGITGSAGKTTVKEMTGAIMQQSGATLVTAGNLNNDIGVPLTLFGLADEHTAAVVEMGANQPGDIALLSAIAAPTVGVVTRAAASHLEGFGDLETIAHTKGAIIEGLPPTGIAIINADDAYAPLWHDMAGERERITFGTNGMVHGRIAARHADALQIELDTPAGALSARLHHLGEHNLMNAAAATAAALAAGCTLAQIKAGLETSRPAARRLNARPGPWGSTLIDDTYNANPASARAALDVLAAMPGRRWFVFGDMGELGDAAAGMHREIGREASAAGVERMFTLGDLSRETSAAFTGTAEHFDSHEALATHVGACLEEAGAPVTVLFKASRMMTLDTVVDAVAAAESSSC